MSNINFSDWWDIHNKRLSMNGKCQSFIAGNDSTSTRALFGDWGRLGNISIDHDYIKFTQFNRENSLSYKNYSFYYVKNDELLLDSTNSHCFISNRKELLSTFSYFTKTVARAGPILKKKNKGDMETIMKLVNGDKNLSKLKKHSKFIPPFIHYLAAVRPDLLQNETAHQITKLSSPDYSGGCIKIITFQDKTFVIYCDGYGLSKLTVKILNVKENVLENTSINNFKLSEEDDQIFQIDVAKYYDELCHILIRSMNCISCFQLIIQYNGLKIQKISSLDSIDEFISCKLSPSWRKELIATVHDKINLYDSENMKVVWAKEVQCYSSVIDQWNEIQSTTIPKTWHVTNRASTNFYDCRSHPSSSGVELFTKDALSLSKKEYFFHASNIFNNHYFYLYSTFNAIQIDVRNPGRTVNQWTMPMSSPASYSSLDTLGEIGKLNVTVGCQMDAKHIVYQQYIDNNSKATAISSKSLLSRENFMSLGVATHFNEQTNELSVLTLDSNANVIGNQYVLNEDLYHYHTCQPNQPPPYKTGKRFKEADFLTKPVNSYQFGVDYLSEMRVLNSDFDYQKIDETFGITNDSDSDVENEF